MNYNTAFSIAARSAEAHSAIQRYIRHECPVLEQRLKERALITAIAFLEFIVAAIDWVQGQIDRAPEYHLQLQLAIVRAKRYCIRIAIKLAMFDERYQLTAKASRVWSRKGAIATQAMDSVFCLR